MRTWRNSKGKHGVPRAAAAAAPVVTSSASLYNVPEGSKNQKRKKRHQNIVIHFDFFRNQIKFSDKFKKF
jgi:hypothetical protein